MLAACEPRPVNLFAVAWCQRSPASAQFLQFLQFLQDKVQRNRYPVVTGSGCFHLQTFLIYKVVIISKNSGLPEGNAVYSSIFYRFSLNGVPGWCSAYPAAPPLETGGERHEDKHPDTLSATPTVSFQSAVHQSGLGEVARRRPRGPGLRHLTTTRTDPRPDLCGVLLLLSGSLTCTHSLHPCQGLSAQIQPKQSAVSAWHQRTQLHG